jgi:hypothetical protein
VLNSYSNRVAEVQLAQPNYCCSLLAATPAELAARTWSAMLNMHKPDCCACFNMTRCCSTPSEVRHCKICHADSCHILLPSYDWLNRCATLLLLAAAAVSSFLN